MHNPVYYCIDLCNSFSGWIIFQRTFVMNILKIAHHPPQFFPLEALRKNPLAAPFISRLS